MMSTYRELFPKLGGFLTNKNQIHLSRLELFLQELSRREPLYFQQRAMEDGDNNYATKDYKDHYYRMKFGTSFSETAMIEDVAKSYLEGLYWILSYYHFGCVSWTWYYPYLYSPMASDLQNLSRYRAKFDQGRPFTPLLQLLAVLPPQSSHLLPNPYAKWMTDLKGPLTKYYPREFISDPNGKRNAWESIVQIPFIEENVLIQTLSTLDHTISLSKTERARNLPGVEHRMKSAKHGRPESSNILKFTNALLSND
jgi:5'-3' exonuclease